jgi:hypothetical protein
LNLSFDYLNNLNHRWDEAVSASCTGFNSACGSVLKSQFSTHIMMRSSKIRIVLFMSVVYSLFAAVFSACSGDDEHSGSRPVEIFVSTGFDPVTRGEGSISEGDILSGKSLPLSVVRIDQVSESDGSYTPYANTNDANGVGAHRDGHLQMFNWDEIRIEFDDTEYYLDRTTNNKTKLIAWYPAVGSGAGDSEWNVDGGGVATVGFTVDGSTDILFSNLVEGSKDNPYDKNSEKVTFSHLLTRFRVRVYAYDTDVEGQFGKIKSISVVSAQKAIAQLPAVGAASGAKPTTTFTGTSELPIIRKDPADHTPIAYDLVIPILGPSDPNDTTTGLAGYVLVAPVANTDEVTLKVETEYQGTKEVKIKAPNVAPNADGFGAGKSYTLALEFRTKGLEFVNVTILDWEEEETITADIE